MVRTLKVFFHDGCFDGVSSTAMFARFYRDAVDGAAALAPIGMAHTTGDPFASVAFDATDHACVDFRYSPAPAMRWWFDHHATAFQPAELRTVFQERALATHIFDPHAPSCAGLIARSLAHGFGWQPPPHLRELAEWADRIDSLDYPSAAAATSLEAPAQRLSVYLASAASPADTARLATLLVDRSLAELAALPEVAAAADKVAAERAHTLTALRQVAIRRGDVVQLDLLAEPGRRAPGLLCYLLFPDCRYAVSAVVSAQAVRISVGHNPWSGAPPAHHLGELCQRFGGGGHHGVGGVTLAPHEVELGRRVLHQLVDALRG